MRRPGDYDGPVDYRCLRPVQCASGTHALTIQCQGSMRLVDGCAEPVLLCDLCGRVAALEPMTPTTVHYRGVEYEVLTDALVDGAWWLVLFDPATGGLGLWVRCDDADLGPATVGA